MKQVTAYICTRGRYQTTLPLAMMAVISQTQTPAEFILWDDNPQPEDLRKMLPYANLFDLMTQKGIEWKVMFGGGKGQVQGHEWVNQNAKGDLCWRVDDDCIPESSVLESLTELDDAAAVGGCIHVPGRVPDDCCLSSGKIEHIYGYLSPQMFKPPVLAKPRTVDHLHCSFVYRPRVVSYPTNLSVVGHREETMFTHSLVRAGLGVYFNPHVVSWHLRQPIGGIRNEADGQAWALDEEVFKSYLNQHGITAKQDYKLLVDMCGLGDAWVMRRILPELSGGSKVVVASMHQEVWDGADVELMPPMAASMVHGDLGRFSPYVVMASDPSIGLEEAFRRIYA